MRQSEFKKKYMILMQTNIQDNIFGAASAPSTEKEYLTELDPLARLYLKKNSKKQSPKKPSTSSTPTSKTAGDKIVKMLTSKPPTVTRSTPKKKITFAPYKKLTQQEINNSTSNYVRGKNYIIIKIK